MQKVKDLFKSRRFWLLTLVLVGALAELLIAGTFTWAEVVPLFEKWGIAVVAIGTADKLFKA